MCPKEYDEISEIFCVSLCSAHDRISEKVNLKVCCFESSKQKQKSIFTNDKSIFTNDISLILDRGPMIGYIWSHAPPCIAPILTLYKMRLKNSGVSQDSNP